MELASLRVQQESNARPVRQNARVVIRRIQTFQERVDSGKQTRHGRPVPPEQVGDNLSVSFFRQRVSAENAVEQSRLAREPAAVNAGHVRERVHDVHTPFAVDLFAGRDFGDLSNHGFHVVFVPDFGIFSAAFAVEASRQNAEPFSAGQRLDHNGEFRRRTFRHTLFGSKSGNQSRRFV